MVLGVLVSVTLLGGGVGVLMGERDEVGGLGESLVAWLTLRGDMFVGGCAVGKCCGRRPLSDLGGCRWN